MPEAAPHPNCPPTPGRERRACVRYACDLRSLCQFVSAVHSTLWFARVLNVSARGLALVLPHVIEPGALLDVSVETPGGLSRSLRARVAHCTPYGRHEWIAGCELAKELTVHDLLELLV